MKTLSEFKESFSILVQRNPFYTMGAVLLIVIVAWGFLIFRPLVKNIAQTGRDITDIRQKRQKSDIHAQRVDDYRRQIVQLKKDYGAVEISVVRDGEVPAVLEKISSLANKHQIKIDNVLPRHELKEPVLEDGKTKYFPLEVAISARGGYHNAGRFLNDIEQLDIFLKVRALSILPHETDSRNHHLTFLLEAVTIQ
jgi:Tfp pilus assembly protein PilO